MKLLTLNTHSLIGENNVANCHILCSKIAEEMPDVIALQEVNQLIEMPVSHNVPGYVGVGEIPLKESNFALSVQKILVAMGKKYSFSWLGIKKGYDKFDEGICIFSKLPIKEARSMLLSNTSDYNNFKKRMALFIENEMGIFASCHLGWENDVEEPFCTQLIRLGTGFKYAKPAYLMGDFNVHDRSDGYKKLTAQGWHDTYLLAEEREGCATISGNIDGWDKNFQDLRIDYIFSNKSTKVKKSKVLFDGKKDPVISDHFAVMVTI